MWLKFLFYSIVCLNILLFSNSQTHDNNDELYDDYPAMCGRRRYDSLRFAETENLVRHPESNEFYDLTSFMEKCPDIDINHQSIYEAKECPCAPGRYCLHMRFCKRSQTELGSEEWPWQNVNGTCNNGHSKGEELMLTIWPAVWFWVMFMFAALGYTEIGRNARDFIFYRGIMFSLTSCLSDNISWMRFLKQTLRKNRGLERLVDERLAIERERRRQRRNMELQRLQATVTQRLMSMSRDGNRQYGLTDIMSNDIQLKLMLRKKLFRCPLSTDPDPESGGHDSEVCSICLDNVEVGTLIGNIECGHIFHLHCLKEWVVRDNCCPVCKHENVAYIKMRKVCTASSNSDLAAPEITSVASDV